MSQSVVQPSRAALAAGSAPRVDYRDPLAVAGRYVTTRWTYSYTDPGGYAAALTAQTFTSPAFAARSRPGPSAFAAVRKARETSRARVVNVELDAEAPHTPTSTYATATFRTVVTYRGSNTARALDHLWSLRLVRDDGRRWRVDAVLYAG